MNSLQQRPEVRLRGLPTSDRGACDRLHGGRGPHARADVRPVGCFWISAGSPRRRTSGRRCCGFIRLSQGAETHRVKMLDV